MINFFVILYWIVFVIFFIILIFLLFATIYVIYKNQKGETITLDFFKNKRRLKASQTQKKYVDKYGAPKPYTVKRNRSSSNRNKLDSSNRNRKFDSSNIKSIPGSINELQTSINELQTSINEQLNSPKTKEKEAEQIPNQNISKLKKLEDDIDVISDNDKETTVSSDAYSQPSISNLRFTL